MPESLPVHSHHRRRFEVLSRIKRDSSAGPRHVILHYHIFKNAGSTIYSILERNFGRRLASLESGHFNATVANEGLLAFLEKHPRLQAVSSHHLLPPRPVHQDFVFHDILFLRNPLARLSSMYSFYRRTDATDDPLIAQAKRRTTADFMQLLIQQYPRYVNNAQVNFLSARNRMGHESPLETAFRVACEATVLGVTELFDLSAVLADRSLASRFEGINFGYVAQNVSSMAPRELDVHLSQFREACGDDTYDQLVQSNSLDLTLLKLATEEIYRRFDAIPDHDERLQHFLQWRSILHPSAVRGVLASNHPHDFVRYANLDTN
jgi:Sulfotransferase family